MSKDFAPLPASFDRLAWSNLAAQSAEQLALAAAPLVAVLALGADAAETGGLQTVLTLPFVLFAIPAGLLADRMRRRTLMAAAEALRTVALLATVALIVAGALTLPLLAGLGFLAVCGTVAYSVAAPALLPALVPARALPAANARVELARTVAFAGGPALGGALVGWTGGAPCFALAAALSLAAVALLAGIDEPLRRHAPRRRPILDIREGAAFVFRHRLLRPVFATQVIFNTAWFVMLAVFVPHAAHRLGLSASGIGVILAMYGVGMVAGALVASRVLAALPFGTVIAIGPVAGLVAAILIAMTAVVPSPVLAGVGLFLLGVGPILWTISTTTLRQTVTPPDLLGRVSAINIMAYGARPLGSALGAGIALLWSAEACLYAGVAGFALQAAVILASPVAKLRGTPDSPDSALPACEAAAAR